MVIDRHAEDDAIAVILYHPAPESSGEPHVLPVAMRFLARRHHSLLASTANLPAMQLYLDLIKQRRNNATTDLIQQFGQ